MEMIDITCPNCRYEIHVYSSAQLGTNLTEVGTRAVRGYSIDADYLMAKVAEEYGERARDALYRIIRYIPPAQPERKTGKWIYITDGHYEYFKCDQCEKHSGEPTPFCRYCGADMREGQDDNRRI